MKVSCEKIGKLGILLQSHGVYVYCKKWNKTSTSYTFSGKPDISCLANGDLFYTSEENFAELSRTKIAIYDGDYFSVCELKNFLVLVDVEEFGGDIYVRANLKSSLLAKALKWLHVGNHRGSKFGNRYSRRMFLRYEGKLKKEVSKIEELSRKYGVQFSWYYDDIDEIEIMRCIVIAINHQLKKANTKQDIKAMERDLKLVELYINFMEESVQEESVQEESVQEESVQEESVQEESVQVESVQVESVQVESVQVESVQE